MKRIFKYILVALIAIVFLGTFLFLFWNSKPKELQYQEVTVARADIQRSAVVTGKIVPRNEVNIKPQINGIIAELYKEAGQPVQQNEVIAKLKVIPDMNSLSSAQSRVRLADINLKQAATNLEREKALHDKNLVSDDEYDKVLQQYNQAKEERAAAQDALEVIRDGVSKANAKSSSTLVRSTVTGLILDIPVKVGNSVIQANTMNHRGRYERPDLRRPDRRDRGRRPVGRHAGGHHDRCPAGLLVRRHAGVHLAESGGKQRHQPV